MHFIILKIKSPRNVIAKQQNTGLGEINDSRTLDKRDTHPLLANTSI